MIPFGGVLNEADRRHLESILEGPPGPDAGTRAKARRFLAESTFVDEASAGAFRALPQGEREQLISDLAWRVTCHVEGSITRVMGVNAFDLGSGFSAVHSEQAGRDVFCLVRPTGA